MPPIAGAGAASSLGISTMMDSVVVIRDDTLQKQGKQLVNTNMKSKSLSSIAKRQHHN
jgi:hypothetical protein